MIKAIVTDIEGTTSSLSFVKDTLFPYARKNISEFIFNHKSDEAVSVLLDDVRREVGEKLSTDAVIQQLIDWVDTDQKVTALKALQGLMWEKGYKEGDFTGHVYPDAMKSLRQWNEDGIRLFVYSSGSVYAQKLLFGYSDFGDLTPYFENYFDTNTGAKTEVAAYRKIADAIGLPTDSILFLSDIERELDAAKDAGLYTTCLQRPDSPKFQSKHTMVQSFDEIDLNNY